MQITYYPQDNNKVMICFREWLADDRNYPRKNYWDNKGNYIRVPEGEMIPEECKFYLVGDPSCSIVEEFEKAIVGMAETIKCQRPYLFEDKTSKEIMRPLNDSETDRVFSGRGSK